MTRILLLAILCLFPVLFSSCATGGNTHHEAGDDAGGAVIPRGWFMMGSNSGEINERPEHEVFLDAFRLDRYEVSAAEFAEFLNAKGNPDNKFFTPDIYSTVVVASSEGGKATDGAKGQPKYAPRQGFERYPANNVSWYGADAYCRWKGQRLPSEAEWEKAGKGVDMRTYPWGNSPPDPVKARYGQKIEDSGLHVMVPVDSLNSGVSPYGMYNMAGNVWEWVADWYRQNYCDFCDPGGDEFAGTAAEILRVERPAPAGGGKTEVPPVYNSQGPEIGIFKVLRGGAWSDGPGPSLRNTLRYWLDPLERYSNTGFRCAD